MGVAAARLTCCKTGTPSSLMLMPILAASISKKTPTPVSADLSTIRGMQRKIPASLNLPRVSQSIALSRLSRQLRWQLTRMSTLTWRS